MCVCLCERESGVCGLCVCVCVERESVCVLWVWCVCGVGWCGVGERSLCGWVVW